MTLPLRVQCALLVSVTADMLGPFALGALLYGPAWWAFVGVASFCAYVVAKSYLKRRIPALP